MGKFDEDLLEELENEGQYVLEVDEEFSEEDSE